MTKADADYDVLIPDLPSTTPSSGIQEGGDSTFIPNQTACQASSDAGFTIAPLGRKELPTLYHIVDQLAEVPVFEVVEARLCTEEGVRDFSDARTIN